MGNEFNHEVYNAYREGLECGRSAAFSKGGTRGAEWYADNRSLQGEARDEFISGFNEGLEEGDYTPIT